MVEGKESNSEPQDTENGDKAKPETLVNETAIDPDKSLDKMNKSELLEKNRQLTEECKKNYDLYLRSQAEMENMKKRNKRDREEWLKYANETLIKEILPIVDNLERAIDHCRDDVCLASLREGVELTLKNLKTVLAKSGVEEVKSCGEDFDPCYHEAVAELADEKTDPGKILREFQKGYILNKRLIRPAKVVVCKAGQANETADLEKVCGKDMES